MTLYQKIKALCEKNGFSISSIGDKIPELKVNKSSMTGWKNGARPRPDKIKAIADYFGVTVEYLYSAEEKELPTSNEEFINMLKKHNQGKAQVFFCGTDGKVFELSPEEEAIMQNLFKLRKDNK